MLQLAVLHPFVGFFQLFMDPNADLLDHSGGVDDGLESAKANQNAFACAMVYSIKVFLYFVAGDYDASIKALEDRYGCLTRMEGSIHETFVLYLGGLIFFGVARRATNAQQKRKLLKRARRCMRLLKGLAKQNPASCLGKFVLLEAENASLAKKDAVAKEKYEHAIALAAKYGSYFELAFANQVAGEHYTHLNDIESGLTYFKEACKTYDDWGGLAAVTHLKKKIAAFEKVTKV
jgi:tetratricopeptide (TPR) repeat protein